MNDSKTEWRSTRYIRTHNPRKSARKLLAKRPSVVRPIVSLFAKSTGPVMTNWRV